MAHPHLDAILARLLTLHPKRIDLSLDRMYRVLDALGHPEKNLPPVIHVAGTNGKGSTIAFMRAILEAAGALVHVYTSPNLVRMNERFRLGRPGGGVLVSDGELVTTLAECEQANGAAPITVFEIETAAAFLLFSRHPADALLLEVGLGGRLDATNVIPPPLASVITPVSMDHMEFLGDTLEKIAGEKAAILRTGTPAAIGRQTEGPLSVILQRAEEIAAPLHVCGQDWIVGEERGRLVYQDQNGLFDLPAPRLFGRHQIDNAGTAIAALRAAGFKLPVPAYERGIAKADWPARMQRLVAGDLFRAHRPAARCGSTAVTTRKAAASPRRRSPISRNGSPVPSSWSRACWPPRIMTAFSATSSASRAGSWPFRSRRKRRWQRKRSRRRRARSGYQPTRITALGRHSPPSARLASIHRRVSSSPDLSISPAKRWRQMGRRRSRAPGWFPLGDTILARHARRRSAMPLCPRDVLICSLPERE